MVVAGVHGVSDPYGHYVKLDHKAKYHGVAALRASSPDNQKVCDAP